MSEIWVTREDVYGLEGISKSTFKRRFKKNHYKTHRYASSQNGGGKNGSRLEIALSSLSAGAQIAWAKKSVGSTTTPVVSVGNDVCDDKKIQAPAQAQPPALICRGIAKTVPDDEPADQRLPALKEEQYKNALAKADLLRFYQAALKKAHRGKKGKARDDFILAYNSGLAYPKLYETLGPKKWSTVEGWKKQYQKSKDALALADRRGYCKRGNRDLTITEEQSKIFLACALHPNRLRISEALRMARAVMHSGGTENGPSDATYRRWLKDWISSHEAIWVFHREGSKAWNDKCAMYLERDNNLINVGDVIVADGHVLNFEILNPWTGKPKRMILLVWKDMKSNFPLGWEIMPTEDTQAISSALRRAILRLGKYPKVAYLDNGKAFKARFFTGCDFDQEGFEGLYARLGIKTIFAWPYHGQSKTVERFFGSFAELERLAPTYVGTSIDKKPPRMMRGEKLHRRVYEKMTGGGCITLEQAHTAIASWFDAYVERPQRGKLAGKAPIDLFLEERGPGIDAAELTYLMMKREYRNIGRNGVKVHGQNYYDPALYGRRHSGIIRYDEQDKTKIYVFDRNDEFICEARPVEKAHPAANILGTAEDQERLKKYITEKKHQEKAASVSARAFLETEIMPQTQKMLEDAGLSIQGPQPANTNIKRLPAPTDSEKALKKEVDAILLKQREERTKEEEETKRRIDEGMRQYHESLGKIIRRKDINPDIDIPEEEILKDDPKIWKILPQMQEKDRYEKLAEFEVRGWLVPKQWQAFMSYFEQTPEYLSNQDYFDDHRSRIVMMYQLEEEEIK